jgi:hypothetical protein
LFDLTTASSLLPARFQRQSIRLDNHSVKYATTRKIHYHSHWAKITLGTGGRPFILVRSGVVITQLGGIFVSHKMVDGMHDIGSWLWGIGSVC